MSRWVPALVVAALVAALGTAAPARAQSGDDGTTTTTSSTTSTTAPPAPPPVPVPELAGLVGGDVRHVSPGVEVFPVSRQSPLLRGGVARLDQATVRDRLRLVVSNEAVAEADGARRETTTSMCRRYRCVVAVNADQWYISGQDISTPVGGTVVDGELWRTPEPNPDPFRSMGQLQIDAAGIADARPAPAGWSTTLRGGEEDELVADLAVNRIPRHGEIALYTSRLGTRTPAVPGVQEWLVQVGPVVEGSTTLNLVSGPTSGGGSHLPPGYAFVAAVGDDAVGTAGGILFDGEATVHVDMGGARWANGGFPVLMEGGAFTIFPNDPGNHRRDPRTLVGWTAGGELLLVTVDGRQPGWSAGLSLEESARLLRTLGAVEAINLDGGGSTTFVLGGHVLNRPSDGSERSVVNALVVVPPEGIDFGTASPRVPALACPDGQVPAAPFDDLSGAATHAGAIACAAWRQVAGGTGPRAYGPVGHVSRAQMATFIVRLLLAAGVAVPGEVPDAFTDDGTSVHHDAINRLAAMGVVGGVGGGRYDPEGSVTRAQMGTFLARALRLATGGAVGPLAERDYFADDSLDLHEQNINVIAEHGIAGGVAVDRYDPGGRVSRAQMASFLVRTLDAALTPR